MNTLSLTDNEFEGIIPPDIGLKMPNLQQIGIGGNEFSGTIQLHFPMLLSFKYLTSQKTILWGKFQQVSEIFQISAGSV
ncbi:hypothetical protein ACFXTO_001431 [Malus domestica]